ncbi:MAG: hypothetical protein AAGI53_16985 [Planctomycetota bacterium]
MALQRGFRRCLFGGVLAAAGVGASAQTFTFQDDSSAYASSAYVRAIVGLDSQEDLAGAPNDLNLSRTAIDGGGAVTARTGVSSGQLRVDALWNGGGAGDAEARMVLFQNFTVDSDLQLLVEWDLTGHQGTGGINDIDFLRIIDVDNNETVVYEMTTSSDPLAGSAMVDVVSGVQYMAYFSVTGVLTSSDLQFLRATLVPSPASGALLVVGGLVSARRRRFGA